MDFSNGKKMETPRKIVEPLITIPKPRPSALHQQQMQQIQQLQQLQQLQQQHQQMTNNQNSDSPAKIQTGATIYSELLEVIEEINLYVRPCYLGHRASMDKVRQLITKARQLVRLCLMETEKAAFQ